MILDSRKTKKEKENIKVLQNRRRNGNGFRAKLIHDNVTFFYVSFLYLITKHVIYFLFSLISRSSITLYSLCLPLFHFILLISHISLHFISQNSTFHCIPLLLFLHIVALHSFQYYIILLPLTLPHSTKLHFINSVPHISLHFSVYCHPTNLSQFCLIPTPYLSFFFISFHSRILSFIHSLLYSIFSLFP